MWGECVRLRCFGDLIRLQTTRHFQHCESLALGVSHDALLCHLYPVDRQRTLFCCDQAFFVEPQIKLAEKQDSSSFARPKYVA